MIKCSRLGSNQLHAGLQPAALPVELHELIMEFNSYFVSIHAIKLFFCYPNNKSIWLFISLFNLFSLSSYRLYLVCFFNLKPFIPISLDLISLFMTYLAVVMKLSYMQGPNPESLQYLSNACLLTRLSSVTRQSIYKL